jgi:hypothetical protein
MWGDQWLCSCGTENFFMRRKCRDCSRLKPTKVVINDALDTMAGFGVVPQTDLETFLYRQLAEREELLIKYIDHVSQCTGQVFLWEIKYKEADKHLIAEKDSLVKFSPEEIALLKQFAGIALDKPRVTEDDQ